MCAPMSYSWPLFVRKSWQRFRKAPIKFFRAAWHFTTMWYLLKGLCSIKSQRNSKRQHWMIFQSLFEPESLYCCSFFFINISTFEHLSFFHFVEKQHDVILVLNIYTDWGHDDCINKVCRLYQRDVSFQTDYSGLEHLHEYVSLCTHLTSLVHCKQQTTAKPCWETEKWSILVALTDHR